LHFRHQHKFGTKREKATIRARPFPSNAALMVIMPISSKTISLFEQTELSLGRAQKTTIGPITRKYKVKIARGKPDERPLRTRRVNALPFLRFPEIRDVTTTL
jgi:hypothetical protein